MSALGISDIGYRIVHPPTGRSILKPFIRRRTTEAQRAQRAQRTTRSFFDLASRQPWRALSSAECVPPGILPVGAPGVPRHANFLQHRRRPTISLEGPFSLLPLGKSRWAKPNVAFRGRVGGGWGRGKKWQWRTGSRARPPAGAPKARSVGGWRDRRALALGGHASRERVAAVEDRGRRARKRFMAQLGRDDYDDVAAGPAVCSGGGGVCGSWAWRRHRVSGAHDPLWHGHRSHAVHRARPQHRRHRRRPACDSASPAV